MDRFIDRPTLALESSGKVEGVGVNRVSHIRTFWLTINYGTCINSTQLSTDPDDFTPLTPGRLLTGEHHLSCWAEVRKTT